MAGDADSQSRMPASRLVLGGHLARALPALAIAMGTFYIFLAALATWVLDAPAAMVWAWSASAMFFVAAAAWLRKYPVPAQHSHAVAAVMSAVIVFDGSLLLYTTAVPTLTEALAITILGFALILFSQRLTLAIIAASLAGWALAASHAGWSPTWTAQGLGLLAVCVVAWVVQGMRVKTYTRIDVLHRKELDHAARAQELDQIKRTDAFKGELLSLVAHELATPVTPLRLQLANIRSAQGPEGEERRKHALDAMERNLLRLNRVMGDVVLVARDRIRPASLRLEDVDLSQLLANRAASWGGAASERGLRIQTILQPALVRGDAGLLGRAVDKLLDNAVKFSRPGGRIELAIGAGDASYEVRVADDGPGVVADKVDGLFEVMAKAHDPMQRTDSGVGLGLKVASLVADAHGGAIRFEPNPGGGSVFVLSLPA